MTTFYKTISESEAYYSIKDGKIIKSGGGQSSYNLPKKFFKYTTDKKILIQDSHLSHSRKYIDGDAYVLNEDYKFKVGFNALSLIGNEYDNDDNEFIASMNGTNNKFQIYRKAYVELGWEYDWFVELYDINLSGNQLILNINEKDRIFTLDIEFIKIDLISYIDQIKKLKRIID